MTTLLYILYCTYEKEGVVNMHRFALFAEGELRDKTHTFIQAGMMRYKVGWLQKARKTLSNQQHTIFEL